MTLYAARQGGLYCDPGGSELRAEVGPFCSPITTCTAKTMIYCANMAAGFMVAHFAKWLRGFIVEPDINLNLLAHDLSCP